jgi:hypothetical protein
VESFKIKLGNLFTASEGNHKKHSLRQTLLKLKSNVEPFECKSKVPATVRKMFSQAEKNMFCKFSLFFSNLTTMHQYVK